MGSTNVDANGLLYANAGVKIARDIYVSVDFPVYVMASGPGFTNAASVGFIQELAGTISGTGCFRFAASGGTQDGILSELVLSGSSEWSGGENLDFISGNRFMTGPGGLGFANLNPGGLVRFVGNASLPHGNSGSNCYAAALGRSWNSRFGFLLTGSSSNTVYTLTNGVRFVLGGPATLNGTLGSYIGQATLSDSMVIVHDSTNTENQSVIMLVRDSSSVFNLGSSVGSVRFASSASTNGNNLGNGWYPNTYAATPLYDRFTTNTIIKRGLGTLVLSNVQYTLLDGTGDISSNFYWSVGSGTSPNQFDGVILETGSAISNSLRASKSVVLNGAIMGLISDFAPVLGTNGVTGAFFSMASSGNAGVGFAAYGGTRTVTLTPRAANELNWGQTGSTANDFFMQASGPLFLNAPDANAPIVLASAYTNQIRMSTPQREIRVYDNPATNTDEAILNIKLTNAGNLIKTGAGSLTLGATNNDYNGYTYISNGTLNVNGKLLGSSSNIFVCSGATLGGTGTVSRPVTVQSGGVLTAAAAGHTGTLTLSSNLTLNASGSVSIDISASGNDRINVGSGAVVLAGMLNVVSIAGYDLPSGGNVTIMTSPVGFSGAFSSVTHGYSTRLSSDGLSLYLHRDSPGFIFRIQ
jgi:autotransporter-associated beta strand protein